MTTTVSVPAGAPALLGSASEARDLVLASVKFANEAQTPQAWRLVARLMQAEGREEQAQRMLLRATEIERSAASKQPKPASPPAIPAPPTPAKQSPQ